MRKIYILAIAAAVPAFVMAQSAIDAQQISQPDFKGTARFMSMGGAFTALGGDLSTMMQNPAGIGIYRSSEVGVTVDFDLQSTQTSPAVAGAENKMNQTKVYCNNFGYIGTSPELDGALKRFNWGVSYNRAASFDRIYSGYVPSTSTSLTNYIASFTNGVDASSMDFDNTKNYNPYYDSDNDWLSILAYNSYMINPIGSNRYAGLYGNGTAGDALYRVREKGYIDEYEVSFGGNVDNVVYWGVGLGITDLKYTRTAFYSESLGDAQIVNMGEGAPVVTGDAGFDLNNYKYINGTGWNMKLGVIVKPINELRIGLAVHTPTWYRLEQSYDGTVDYSYFNPALAKGNDNPLAGNEYSETAYFNWRMNSPWKLTAGVAGIIGTQAIVSLDYEYDAYGNMGIRTPYYDANGYIGGYETNDYLNGDIKDYFKASNTVRLGVEYRVTPQFSLRAGYNYQTSNVRSTAYDGQIEVVTWGTDPSYSFDNTTQYITAGLGYRYKMWYIDAAYVYKNRESVYHAYTNFDGMTAPSQKLADKNSSIVISTGIKF